MPTSLSAAIAASSREHPRDHTSDSFLTRAPFLVNERLLAREPSRATSRATEKPLKRGTSLVSFSSGLAASAAALVATISRTSTTGDPGGHNDGPHNNRSIEVASTAGSPGTPMVESTGTPMVESIGTLAASAAALASTISTTSMTGDDGHDDGPNNKGSTNVSINVASLAGTICTPTNRAGTVPVDVTCCMTGLTATATTLALQATINTTSDGQRVSTVDNAGNDGGGMVVPPEFAGGDFGTAGKMQQLTAASGDDDATPASSPISTTTAGNPSHDNRTINLASMAGTICTSINKAGTSPARCTTDHTASAVALASTDTTTTSGRQRVYTVNNADNNGGRNVVTPEFTGDGDEPAGGTQHFATNEAVAGIDATITFNKFLPQQAACRQRNIDDCAATCCMTGPTVSAATIASQATITRVAENPWYHRHLLIMVLDPPVIHNTLLQPETMMASATQQP